MEDNNFNNVPNNQYNGGDEPGKGAATASLILGIVSLVCWFFGAGSLIGLGCGIAGLICASSAKNAGNNSGIRTAGFVCSLIGLIGSVIVFVACIACLGVIGAGAAGAEAAGYSDIFSHIR